VETDRLNRVAVEAAREVVRRSGEHQVCFNEDQLDRIEKTGKETRDKVEAIEIRLINGDNLLQTHDDKISELRRVVFGGIGFVILGVLTTAGGALLWVISHYKGNP